MKLFYQLTEEEQDLAIDLAKSKILSAILENIYEYENDDLEVVDLIKYIKSDKRFLTEDKYNKAKQELFDHEEFGMYLDSLGLDFCNKIIYIEDNDNVIFLDQLKISSVEELNKTNTENLNKTETEEDKFSTEFVKNIKNKFNLN